MLSQVLLHGRRLEARGSEQVHAEPMGSSPQRCRSEDANMDYRSVTFLTLNGVEISEQHHHDVIGEDLPLPVPGKKAKSKFTKK